jgi:hypothetical protein
VNEKHIGGGYGNILFMEGPCVNTTLLHFILCMGCIALFLRSYDQGPMVFDMCSDAWLTLYSHGHKTQDRDGTCGMWTA